MHKTSADLAGLWEQGLAQTISNISNPFAVFENLPLIDVWWCLHTVTFAIWICWFVTFSCSSICFIATEAGKVVCLSHPTITSHDDWSSCSCFIVISQLYFRIVVWSYRSVVIMPKCCQPAFIHCPSCLSCLLFQHFVKKNLDVSEVPLDSYGHLSPCDGFASRCYWTIATVAHTSLGGRLWGQSKLETGLPFIRGAAGCRWFWRAWYILQLETCRCTKWRL